MLKLEILSESQRKLFEEFQNVEWLKDFYLAGGTALALHLEHRKSEDFDFFTSKEFNNKSLLKKIQEISKFELLSADKNTMYINILGVRISFISYQYKILVPFHQIKNLNISSIRDIACNKLSAISSRGTKKDFVDLFFILKNYNIQKIFEDFVTKFGKDYFNEYLLLKSLMYFEDADIQPMPVMIEKADWLEIKNHFIELASKL